jgi:fumarate reductase flavoprotein subunit
MGGHGSVDVVIVGGGLAGFCAAIDAAESGARVLLIEKRGTTGGSTALSGGFFVFAGTPLQERLGITDTAQILYDDLYAVSLYRARSDLLQRYCEGQRALYDWLEDQGIHFTAVELSSGQSAARAHKTDAVAMMEALERRAALSRRVEVMRGAVVQRLVRADGCVSGVVVQRNGGESAIMAERGVVLATGGFARSEELLATFAPRLLNLMRHGGVGNTGDGLKMAWQLGAGLADMGDVKTTFGTHPKTGDARHELLLAYYLGAVIVNKAGRRFVDESQSYKTLGEACLGQPDNLAFQIFDQTIRNKSEPGVLTYDFAVPEERGLMLCADSLEELAALCSIDPATLCATISEYNAGVDYGRDLAFGRDGLCNHIGAMTRIEVAPFYAYPSTSFINTTYCGLTIDANARVLDVFGAPIPCLFAAGELTGGFHGGAYMTGSALGKAALFGRIAGRNAALTVRHRIS